MKNTWGEILGALWRAISLVAVEDAKFGKGTSFLNSSMRAACGINQGCVSKNGGLQYGDWK